MKALLLPRTSEAYGQDFLVKSMQKSCGLTVVVAQDHVYKLPHNELKLIISMNLDETCDANCVSSAPHNVPAIAHIHCRYGFYSEKQKNNIRRGLNQISVGISPAHFHKQELKKIFPHVNWRVVYNGVDTHRFRPAYERERNEFRKRLSIECGSRVLLFVGRLESAKGLHILQKLCEQLSGTNITLILQFLSNTSRATRSYSAIARELCRISPDNIIPYPDKNIFDERPVRFADFLFLPSLSEVAPLVVLEAICSGVPVIGTWSTPFYTELGNMFFPPSSYYFLTLPKDHELNAERRDLQVTDSSAEKLASQFIKAASEMAVYTDEQRDDLARAAIRAGFGQESMISRFNAIYDEIALN